ncbi:MAG: TolC family protein [Helicobacteraceae bacterium]|nr:TolC family protein [Helicobacteraceae bacterium]
MKRFILFLYFSLPCFALTLEEAIRITLTQNHTIKEQEYLLEVSKADFKSTQSAFYPSINATYNTLRSNRFQRVDKKTSGNVGANLQYNLFNGFSDFYDFKSANALLESQAHKLEATKEDVILLVKLAYIDVLKQAQHVRVAEESKKLLEEQRRQNTEFYRVGFIHKNDLLKVEVELNNTIQDLLKYKSALNYALQNLMRFVKIKVNLEDLKEVDSKSLTLEFSKLQTLMLQKRSELLLLNKIIESKEFLVQSAKGNFMPELSLNSQYTRYGDDYKLSGRDGIYKDETHISLGVNFNIFSGFSDKYDLESAKLTKLSFYSQKSALLEDLDLQLFSALEAYNLALNAYKISQIALKQAEENYRISKNRYEQRILSTSDFLDAELLLSEAKMNLILNKYAIVESLAQLERITQTTLMQK